MRILIAATPSEVADIAADHIMENAKPGMRLGVATGSSPLGIYERMRQAYARGEFSLEGCTAWALDEYVGVDADHPERYRNVLRRELVGADKTGLTEEDLHTPDGLDTDPIAAAQRYEEDIAPGVDMQILGIGSDGHIGFNEPSGSLASRTHVGLLTQTTRSDNARFFDNDMNQVPMTCITQGLATIMSAKSIVLTAMGPRKAEAIAQLVEGPVSARWPATILQHHPDVLIVVDEPAAERLELADYYREMA